MQAGRCAIVAAILDHTGRPFVCENRVREKFAESARTIRAKYDAAAFTNENTKHWNNADDLSAKVANGVGVRRTLRSRARYERDNNSYLKGMVKTFAGEIVGTGPRLQMQTTNEKANRTIERLFADWCLAVGLTEKLYLFVESRCVDGELFGIFTDNPILDCPVTLDLRPIEAEQVTTPYPDYADLTAVDGIKFDRHGNPRIYDLLPHHPGGDGEFGYFQQNWIPRPIKAADMLHWFRVERAGQARGIPDITPALPLFAQLRRYTLAVLMAAELAASFAAIIKTDLPPGEAASACEAFEVIDIVRGMMQTLPAGADISQFRPEQPVTTFAEFVRCLLREICRCIEMPYSIATGDGSDNNYASGRLEVQSWERKVTLERTSIASRMLNRIFAKWVEEASLIRGYLPVDDLGPVNQWRKAWIWDAFKHVDPAKEENANDIAIKNGTRTLRDVVEADGKNWFVHVDGLKQQDELCKSLGLPNPMGANAPKIAPTMPTEDSATSDQAKGVASAAVA